MICCVVHRHPSKRILTWSRRGRSSHDGSAPSLPPPSIFHSPRSVILPMNSTCLQQTSDPSLLVAE
eukprot:3616556-Rhodomonas_salina.2